jgi:hypothetical protein
MPTGTNTIFVIKRHLVPLGCKITYGRLVSTIRPTKDEVHRVRVTVGGNCLDYPGITTTQCASLTTTKSLLNSTLSTPDAKFMVLDIKNCYYGTPMERYDYMKLPLALIPDGIIAQYNLLDIVHDGYIYIEIRKGMPGLKQAGHIASDCLTTQLAKFGYSPVARTPSLWKYATLPVMFSLVVDDFGVKYTGDASARHLIAALQQMYKISIDWDGGLYLGLTLKWDYVKRTVDLSMPGYVHKALLPFRRTQPPPDGPNPTTVPKSSMPTIMMFPHHLKPKLSPLSSNVLLGPFCIMHSLLTPPCSSPLAPSLLLSPHQLPPKPTMPPSGCWTMLLRTRMLPFAR